MKKYVSLVNILTHIKFFKIKDTNALKQKENLIIDLAQQQMILIAFKNKLKIKSHRNLLNLKNNHF